MTSDDAVYSKFEVSKDSVVLFKKVTTILIAFFNSSSSSLPSLHHHSRCHYSDILSAWVEKLW